VTFTGPGGTGKTRLALQVTAELLDQFAEGVFFVDLAPIREPGLVAATIAQTLGVREEAGKPLIDVLKAHLRDKQLLLLLDNFEQVLAAAPEVSDLLASCPRLKVLVTSRSALNLRGEHELPVPPLSLPDPAHLPPLAALSQYAAVELFIQRAVAVQPEFAVTNESAPAVAEICHRLDGLPLAIELAAARIRLFPPESLLARLGSRLKLLTEGARDLPARQQTLRRAIGWSYDLLGKTEQCLFRRLSVFIGGWTLEAAEAVCAEAEPRIDTDEHGSAAISGEGSLAPSSHLCLSVSIGGQSIQPADVLAGLSSLVEQNLIRRPEEGNSELRFGMLETIREFGIERLEESGEAEEIRRRHAAFFAATAKGATHSELWLARLRAEVANFRAAFSWSLEAGDLETAFWLAEAIGDIYTGQVHLSEVRQRMAELLAHPRAADHPAWRAKVLHRAAQAAWYQSDLDEARRLLEEEAGIGRKLAHPVWTGDALFLLGMLEISLGNLEAARALHEENVTAGQSANHLWRYHRGLHGLAALAEAEGDPEAAQRYLEELMAAFGGEQSQSFMSTWWRHGLGVVALFSGEYGRARDLLEASLERFRAFGDQWAITKTLTRLALALRGLGERQRAVDLCRESLKLTEQIGAREHMISNLETLAGWAAEEGRMERAARLFGAAASLREACHIAIRPAERADYDRHLAAARDTLGEAAFAFAWAAGQALPLDEVVIEALEDAGQT
jgi:predicted ATPase